MLNETGKKIIKCVLPLILAVPLAMLIVYLVYGDFGDAIYPERVKILWILCFYLLLHFFYPIKKLYAFLYKYRWAIGGVLFLFMVLNRYNYSSFGMYTVNNTCEEISNTSEFGYPIFGVPRYIRSDEYLVDVPRILSGQYSGYSGENNIMMATPHSNLVSATAEKSLGGLAFIEKWGYYLFGSSRLGTEFAFSFQWNLPLFLGFLFTWEIFLIITRKKPLLSFMGACLVIYSSFFQWWSFSGPIWTSITFVVCFYYFLHWSQWWQRGLAALGCAIFGARFVVILYPALQVPIGFLVLILCIWMIVEEWQQIRRMRFWDYLMLGLAVVFAVAMIAGYLYESLEYIRVISGTVYPGQRRVEGENVLYHLFIYPETLYYSIQTPANATESTIMTSFFPVGLLGSIWCLARMLSGAAHKDKGLLAKNCLLPTLLILYSLFLGAFCGNVMPSIVARLSLLNRSIGDRAIVVLSLVQVVLLIWYLAQPKSLRELHPVAGAALALGICRMTGHFVSYFNQHDMAGWDFDTLYYEVLEFAVFAASFCFFSGERFASALCRLVRKQKRERRWLVTGTFFVVSLISIISQMRVNPVMKGLDAIYGLEIAQEMEKIVASDPDAIWIAVDAQPGLAVSCGARVINSVNFMPNFELWEKFSDSDLVNEDVYNRYAHINIHLVVEDTHLDYIGEDNLGFCINYNDLKKTGCKYIYSLAPIEDAGLVQLTQIAHEYRSYIYEVNYLD